MRTFAISALCLVFASTLTSRPVVLRRSAAGPASEDNADVALVARDDAKCAVEYTVVAGDICSVIVDKYKIDLDTLYSLNSAINHDCTNLVINQVLCISKDPQQSTGGSDGSAGGNDASKNTGNTGNKVAGSDAGNSGVKDTGNNGGNDSPLFTGDATYYYQNGVAGACGTVHSDQDAIIALHTDIYDNGAHCGRTVQITTGSNVIYATVADACPSCRTSHSIDLSVGAFKPFNDLSVGMFPVSWKFV